MTRRENSSDIPAWKCERFLLGELDEGEMDQIRRRLEQDGALRDRLGELERSNRELLERHPAGVVAQQIKRKFAPAQLATSERPARRAWWGTRLVWVPVALGAAAATFLLLNPRVLSERGFPGTDSLDAPTTRMKGPAAELSLYRRTDAGSERLDNRAAATEHDLIRARYQSDGQTYGLILSVDGRGVLTRHFPPRDDQAALMVAGSHALDFSYELDDAPRWEIFVLASSTESFAVGTVVDAIEGSSLLDGSDRSVGEAESLLQSLELPDDVSLSTLTLIKEVGDEQ